MEETRQKILIAPSCVGREQSNDAPSTRGRGSLFTSWMRTITIHPTIWLRPRACRDRTRLDERRALERLSMWFAPSCSGLAHPSLETRARE